MSRASAEEQLNFLLVCVKHSNAGKVDFDAVAQECGVVSKGAAAKRYERLLKANNATPGNSQTDTEPTTPTEGTPKRTRKAPASKAGTPKAPKATATTPRKRKGGKAAAAEISPAKKNKSNNKVKAEDTDDDGSVSDNENGKAKNGKGAAVKNENEDDANIDDSADAFDLKKEDFDAENDTEVEA